MKKIINNSLSVLIFLLMSNYTIAQDKVIKITGILVEDTTSQPIPYATVVINDKNTKKIISGTTSDDNGRFSISTSKTNFYVEISFMGFETKTITEFKITNGKVILGKIALVTDNEALDEVVVTSEVSKTVFKLDKRVFNVGADISSTGASALEVLNNVPSVTVSIEGEISLRGSSGVQILINGKPSVLADESSNALGTITADMIESIEVITNPSAKYEASGTAGILNIILKKDEKKGWNGSVSINTGIPDNHSVGLSLNRRTENFNLFAQLGAGYRSLPKDSEAINKNLTDNEVIYSDGIEYRNETFYNITLGTDYHINDLNVLTLSGNFAYEIEEQPSETNFSYFDSNNDLISNWVRNETTDATNPKYSYELNYKKQFKNNEEHTFQLSALGRFFGKDQSSHFTNTTISGTDNNSNQETETDFQQADYTFKADYTNPINDTYTLETGAQYVINDVGNDYEVRGLINDVYVVNEELTNNFEYNQKVFGFYATAAYEKEKWGIKAGLRVEQTNLKTLLTNTNESNEQNFSNFFPTLHTSYKVSDNVSFQAGYSRRIFRPRLWDLNPFFNIRNNFNVRVGNPNLQPEFTDSYELTSIYKIGKASLSSSIYHKYTTAVIERVSTFENNVTITTPENIGTNATIGFETNGKYRPNNWLTLTGDFNFNYFDRIGTNETQIFNFSGSQWSSRFGSKIGLPADIDVELTGRYQSSFETVQGNVTGYAFLDLGVRKKIFKGKAIINLGVRDLFESRIQESYVYQPTFETYSFSQRGRFITLGISYGFGKGEAMTYSGGRRR
ncbi:outer membrane beta-barrel family protein [Polaribacter sp. Hel1_85]|uniref:outer membrane beta-barrel family protein n=1 Tax=Polaribacter sp. Hel1_85 TaxID=1250005 RepID=UPI000564663A|nr:outer membrane beta-barrel family protein [Polaribacter sp. Hel1_85]